MKQLISGIFLLISQDILGNLRYQISGSFLFKLIG
jgi:hypothetical protein